ncbi:cytochrome c oxidase assembly protein [Microbacterium sp. No. 7]|uniref:cytochrome c oxidase assembly protein n=1 Tax=Microbacterium sp. No. 7 TaxID=1714373 RepID=UPI0006CFBC7D|nr:cytochrome c oxidase assembly protein [Microbacterium sp. No. 7]ALJ18759.1 copper transporter [Microbacterium sp. No. 7]
MTDRALRLAGPATLVAAALAALIAALVVGGGAAPLIQGDPGAVVRWGLPAAKLVVNLSAGLMAGGLVLTLFALKPDDKIFARALDAASIAAAVFTIAAGTTTYLTFLSVIPATPSADMLFGEQLGQFLTTTEVGFAWLLTTVLGAIVTVLAFAVRGWTTTLLVAALALVTLIPMATQGHSGEETGHTIAVSALSLHLLGAAVWLGGLLLLVLLRPGVPRARLAELVARYSSLALAAYVVVAVSGVARSAVGLASWGDLLSPYGAILLTKVAALIALGAFGAWYRTRLIARMREDAASRRFWSLVAIELAIMGVASGAAAALARTRPPSDTRLPALLSPAEILTGSPLPPEFTPDRWLTAWNLDLLWAVACGFAAFFYVVGVVRLRRRGDHWPLHRTILWLFGIALLAWTTSGPINAYQEYLFSVHMIGHMLLTMAISLPLVFGAPVTLAARAIRKRSDGTRGGREWILWAVHTPWARVITHPLVAAGVFIGSLWLFYYSDLLRWSMYDHLGHQWMVAHFLISGYLFVQSLVGIDPVPYRLPYPGRLITLLAVMAMHAFFGMSIMMANGLFVAEWFGAMGRTWGPDPLHDQYIGGGVAWSIGEIPTLILAITVAIQWSRSDERASRRADRHADRTGDEELVAYNAKLAALAERDARQQGR